MCALHKASVQQQNAQIERVRVLRLQEVGRKLFRLKEVPKNRRSFKLTRRPAARSRGEVSGHLDAGLEDLDRP